MPILRWINISLHADVKNPISWEALIWLRKLLKPKKLLMSRSTIEPNGLHYPESYYIINSEREDVEPSPCYFAGCVPNMPCKVEAYEKWCETQTLLDRDLDDLDY